MVSSAVRDEESMGRSCGSRIGIPHGDVDVASWRLAGEAGGVADPALAADRGACSAECNEWFESGRWPGRCLVPARRLAPRTQRRPHANTRRARALAAALA